jgi:hypothetical protein
MFRKKTKNQPENTTRRRPVASSGSAQAFSYRASRSRVEQTTGRREEVATPRSSRFSWLVYLPSYIAVAVIVGSLIYASTLTGRPRVEVFGSTESAAILRDKAVYEQATADLMASSILNYSKLTIDTSHIIKELRSQFPELKAANIAIPLVNRQPVVRLELAVPVLTITSEGKQYALNEQGVAMIDTTAKQSGGNIGVPNIEDQTNVPVKVGSPALTADTVRFIRTVVGELQAKGIKVQSLALPRTPQQLHVRLEGQGYYLKFNLLNDAKQQAGTYLALKEKLDKDGAGITEYVDLRVDERAYFK